MQQAIQPQQQHLQLHRPNLQQPMIAPIIQTIALLEEIISLLNLHLKDKYQIGLVLKHITHLLHLQLQVAVLQQQQAVAVPMEMEMLLLQVYMYITIVVAQVMPIQAAMEPSYDIQTWRNHSVVKSA